MDTIYLNEFKEMFHKYYTVKEIIFDDINTILYSNDRFLTQCYLQSALRDKFSCISTIEQNTFNGVPFHYNKSFSIFNIPQIITNFNDFITYIDTLKHNKAIFNKRSLIIISDVDTLSKSQQHVLSVVIERQMFTSFIFTTSSNSKVNERLRSRLLFKKLVITSKQLGKIIQSYAKDQGILDSNLIKQIQKEHTDLYSSILHLHTGIYVDIIKTELMTIVSTIKKIKNIQTFISKIRDVIYKLLVYNVANQIIIRNILDVIANKFAKNDIIMIQCIAELVELDKSLLTAAKPIYHYEHFFLKLYYITNSKV